MFSRWYRLSSRPAEDLAPSAADGEVRLAHVDAGAGLGAVIQVVVDARIADLHADPEVGAQVHRALVRLHVHHRDRGQEAGADAGDELHRHASAVDRARHDGAPIGEDGEHVHVAGKGDGPSLARLHRRRRPAAPPRPHRPRAERERERERETGAPPPRPLGHSRSMVARARPPAVHAAGLAAPRKPACTSRTRPSRPRKIEVGNAVNPRSCGSVRRPRRRRGRRPGGAGREWTAWRGSGARAARPPPCHR